MLHKMILSIKVAFFLDNKSFIILVHSKLFEWSSLHKFK